MRKYHQEKVLELIKTLKEAQRELARLQAEKDSRVLFALLADCQDFALHIGQYIDNNEGEGTKTVALLEKYCDILYFASVAAEKSEDMTQHIDALRAQLGQIEDSVKTELKQNRIEIAFLPYKASMWDSFESIWLAANADPGCDAYVVAIPYFDKNPNGTLGRMHYEGNQYPSHVPIVDWESYNMEERRPDIIITHNPYDEDNLITSVHPHFYSKRLRDLTDQLIYIPYFVVSNDVPAHFCVCAGVCYADKVFVQSEKVRQTYLREFKKFTQAHGSEEIFGRAEDKFVALGSPKFDKIIHLNHANPDIPNAWRALIERPDGTRRKVVLYNTSIGAVLQGNEAYLKKILYVFACFLKRDDVVLLWRPHPLNQATYQSMRPQLMEIYEQIVVQYKRAGYGIYDETPDLHRAIAVSDAYYGDSSSSLVSLYQFTGKPVMMQDVQCVQESGDAVPLVIQHLYDDGTNYWLIEMQSNGLFKMNKQTWEAEYIGMFPDAGHGKAGLYLSSYRAMAHLDGKMYFAPGNADSIAIYDMNDNTFSQIAIAEPLESKGPKYFSNLKFSNVIVYKKAVFFVAAFYPAIIRLDAVTGDMLYITDWVPALAGMTSDENSAFFADSLVVQDNCFVAASSCSNAVICFNMDTLSSTVYSVGSSSNRYSGICYDGNDFWLLPRSNSPVIRWNMSVNRCEEYGHYPNGYSAAQYSFRSIVYADSYVWLFPLHANMCIKLSIATGEMAISEVFQDACLNGYVGLANMDHNYVFALTDSRGKILAYTGKRGTLIALNPKTGEYHEATVTFKKHSSLSEILFINKEIVSEDLNDFNYYESHLLNISDLLDHLVNPDTNHTEISNIRGQRQVELSGREIAHSDGKAGEAIFAYVRGNAL